MSLIDLFFTNRNTTKILCKHNYKPHGWSYAKCRDCGKATDNETIVSKAFDDYIQSRSEGMRNAGFSEEYIHEDNAKITPV